MHHSVDIDDGGAQTRGGGEAGWIKGLAALLAVALIAGVAFAAWRFLPILSIGAGLKAGHMCSAVFVAGRDPGAVLKDELGNVIDQLQFVPDPVVERESRSVVVPLLLGMMPRRAAYRDFMGCTVLPSGSSVADIAALPAIEHAVPPGDPAKIPWPDGDLLSDTPLPAGVDADRLKTALERAFTGEREGPYKTIGVVVVYQGRIIAERYALGFDAHTQYRTWSTAKSITNALVGILVGEGRLDVDEPVPILQWGCPDDPRGKITVANLLHMSSGLKSNGAWTPEAYWGGIDTAEAVVQSQPEKEPGTRWKYSNYDTLLLVRAMKEIIGGDEDYLRFPYHALLNKIGMRDTILEVDPHGNFVLSSQVYTTARDLARFGLLYLNDGVWNGERILPEGWVEYSATPAPATLTLPEDHRAHAGYGAQFWLLGRDPRLPDDAYTTSGARGQHSTIVPSRDLVVVRTGLDPLTNDGWDQRDLVADVLAALPTSD
jgi:CubicO group peptidase (beta-lactamase class C family)